MTQTGGYASAVSTPNVDLHKRIYEALNSGDTDALLAILHPDVEIRSVFAAIGGAHYQGHEGARKWQADLRDAWGTEFNVDIDTCFDLDGTTLCLGLLHGRGGQSGATVTMPATGVARWRDGLCTSHRAFADRQDALNELGVSKESLESMAP
jgi:ketosteroid isomerase-like protein